MAKTGTTSTDFIPDKDDDFYNFVKTLVKMLLKPNKPGETKTNWEAWEIKKKNMDQLLLLWETYEKLYDIAQEKKNRNSGDVDAHRQKRIFLEKFLREMVNEDIRFEKQIPREDKVRMGILPQDTEPSPVHGSHLVTGPPIVGLKNMGGSVIDLRCRRTTDQTRGSVPKGYGVELRHIELKQTDPPPTDPDMGGMKTEVFSKSRNQITAGMQHLGKTFYCYVRWKHKTNPALNSPWTNLLQITIA